jgi:hypothetical protein
MNETCYTLAVRQRTCQNGISRRIENVYTNVNNNTVIPLSFGYLITVVTRNFRNITIQLSNPSYIPNTIFNIPNGGSKTFDLPKENGTIRVFVGATGINCGETVICCRV